MYYVIKNGSIVQLGVDANGAVEVVANFTSGPALKSRDVAYLAEEMVDVLNRDLEDSANDIANTPENIETSDQPLIGGPDKGCPAFSSHITTDVGRHCDRGNFCPWMNETQEEPPAMPRLAGNAALEHDSKVIGRVDKIEEDESGLKLTGTLATDQTGIHPSPLELEYLNGLDRDEDPEHGR